MEWSYGDNLTPAASAICTHAITAYFTECYGIYGDDRSPRIIAYFENAAKICDFMRNFKVPAIFQGRPLRVSGHVDNEKWRRWRTGLSAWAGLTH
jgi:hypothetical protein